MVHDFNRHPEGNPNTGRAAWQFAPRKMHTSEYPLNPHCSFFPKYTPKSQNAWLKGEDPVTCETIYNLKPVYAYPETCVFLKQTEGDNGQWQVWVTSLDGEYRWVSPKAYTNLGYAKRQAMQFRYNWECLVVAIADVPDTEYVVGEKVACCNESDYPPAQLGYCGGTVIETNISAAWVKVQFNGVNPTNTTIFEMRIDHIYSLEPTTFSAFAVGAAHPDFVAADMQYVQVSDNISRKASLVLEKVEGKDIAAWIHDQRTAYPPRDLSTWHIEGYDKDGMLATNHGGESWARHFVQFMHPIGSIRRLVAGSIHAPIQVKVLDAKDGKVKTRIFGHDHTSETLVYDESQLRISNHVDVLTGWAFTWVKITGNKDKFVARASDTQVAWEQTDSDYNDNGEPCIWVEKWLIHDDLLPYSVMYGSKQYLTYNQAQRRIYELNNK